MLEIRVAEDARLPVARTPGMRRRELLEDERTSPRLAGRAQGSASDRTTADHDHVPGVHARRIVAAAGATVGPGGEARESFISALRPG